MNLDNYEIFRENQGTLKELSADDRDPLHLQYMTESSLMAINFDKVKRKYVNSLGLSENNAASVDGLMYRADHVTFLEFKNGSVNNRNVKDKIRDSLLMFCDITGKTISYTRQRAEFILVYNENVNPLPNQYTKNIQRSDSRRYISKRIAQLGKEEIILFDLERYKKLYFRNVHTYSQEEFENYLNNVQNTTATLSELKQNEE